MLAESYIADHAPGWRGRKTAASWGSTLATYADQRLGGMSVAAITTDDVLAVLHPLWSIKTATAMQVRSRIESILDYSKARRTVRWAEALSNAATCPAYRRPAGRHDA